MEAEKILKLDLGLKRKRANSEENEVHSKRPRQETHEEKNETLGFPTEEICEIHVSSEGGITRKLVIEDIRQDGGPHQEALPASSSSRQQDDDGSSPKYSRKEFAPVEIPVNRDDVGLNDENDPVKNDVVISQKEETTSTLYSRETSISYSTEPLTEIKVEHLHEETHNDDESSSTSTQSSSDQTEEETDEYVYRMLRFNENHTIGLHPKNLFSGISLQEHVAEGSKGRESKYISCCKTLSGVKELGSITNESSRVRGVVKINVTKIKNLGNAIQIVDLTDTSIRQNHIDRNSKAWGYAERFEEVILSPTVCTSHIHPAYVEYIGKIHNRTFTPVDDA